jgi:hypothetical protein
VKHGVAPLPPANTLNRAVGVHEAGEVPLETQDHAAGE